MEAIIYIQRILDLYSVTNQNMVVDAVTYFQARIMGINQMFLIQVILYSFLPYGGLVYQRNSEYHSSFQMYCTCIQYLGSLCSLRTFAYEYNTICILCRSPSACEPSTSGGTRIKGSHFEW